LSGSKITFATGAILNLTSDSLLKISNVSIPANSIVATSGIAGNPTSKLINTFISTDNTQTGYTTFGTPATVRTLNTGATTLQEVAQCLGTLISDLKALKLPAT
jgi:hypothetical protein